MHPHMHTTHRLLPTTVWFNSLVQQVQQSITAPALLKSHQVTVWWAGKCVCISKNSTYAHWLIYFCSCSTAKSNHDFLERLIQRRCRENPDIPESINQPTILSTWKPSLFDWKDLQDDIVALYMEGKPWIENPATIHIPFCFKKLYVQNIAKYALLGIVYAYIVYCILVF